MKKIFFILTSVLTVSLVFTSCLKDTNGGKNLSDATGVSKVFEIAPVGDANSGTVNDRIKNVSFTPATTPTNFDIPIYLTSSSNDYFSQDVTVTLERDPTAIATYNSANGTSYTFLPTNTFSEPPLTVTIPKGTNIGFLSLKLFTNLISTTAQYAVAYKITTVPTGSVISNTRSSALYILAIKNKFDGTYTLKSKLLDWLNNFPGNISNTPWTWPGSTSTEGSIYMITSGGASVNMFDNWGFGTYIHPIQTSAGAWSGFGSTNPKFIFDPATNKMIDCVNDYPTPPANGRAFKMNPLVTTSRWDPITGNIYAAIILTQPGRTDLRIFDTLLYKGPR